ncbi:MAG: hypothetical protein DRQ48_00210 [Gammaproteobacteria bacterium]|nr:MAG: hypothetical protein DRQ48_00210 [Gammaproteobacteria bacterium]
MMDIMLDIETLSTKPNAAVFEIAMVVFDKHGALADPHFHVGFKPTTGHICPETVAWWLSRAKVCSLQHSVATEAQAAKMVHDFLASKPKHRLWAMPASFDCIILEQFLERNGYDMPTGFRNWRDLRTVRELANWPDPAVAPGHIGHNALHDVRRQINTLTACWERLAK